VARRSRQDVPDDFSGHLPPQDLDAEQATLGSILLQPETAGLVFSIVEVDDFYREAHKHIFTAMRKVADRNEAIDLITISAELRRAGQLEDVGGGEYLIALMNEVPTASRVTTYAHIVADKSVLRKLIVAGSDIQAMAYDNPADINSLLDRSEAKIFTLAQRRETESFTDIRKLVEHTFEKLEDAYRKPGHISGIPTGLKGLDDITSGLQNGDLIIIAGRPSMGKTSLAVNNICLHVATRENVPVGIFSLEMSKMMLAESMLCSCARVNSWRLRRGIGTDEDWARIGQALGVLPTAPIYVDDTPGLPILELRSKARELKLSKDVGLIIVDYLQLISGGLGSSYENRHQEVSTIARALKGMARELDIPIIALSQLSRRVETREDKRPILSDLAESGSIEAEADLVSFLYRAAYYKQRDEKQQADTRNETEPESAVSDMDTPDEAEVIIAKHRNGPVGNVKVMFEKRYRVFKDMDPYR
jgi:replicative DNA helicase